MRESILLFNVPDKSQLLKIEMALFPLKVRLKHVKKEEYNQPLGVLAGVKELDEAPGTFDGEELSDTMILFAFMDDKRLNQAIAALRKSGAGAFPYKAVLTPTNQHWTAPECFEEIKQEHEAMTKTVED